MTPKKPHTPSKPATADKTCLVCGRRIEWRKKWARDWQQVRYCSTGCRRRGLTDTDQALEAALRDLLGRSRGAPIDPEDAIGRIDRSGAEEADLREPARRAARRLVADGGVEMVQRGRVVDPSRATGPIQIRAS